jgi:ribosome-associated translation inhibitor RaiA/DNA-directed RNA polymerase specialized sigma24 family protein
MKYKIYNLKSLGNESLEKSFISEVEKRIESLKNYFKRYDKKDLVVEIFIKPTSSYLYRISVNINLKSEIVNITEKDKDPIKAFITAYKKLKNTVKEKIKLERKEHLYKRKNRKIKNAANFVEDLKEYSAAKEFDLFKEILDKNLRRIKFYLKHNLKIANLNNTNKGNWKIAQLLDEYILLIYENIDKAPAEKDKFYLWLFKMADKLLQEKFDETLVDFVSIEDLIANEYEQMEETFSADAEGELRTLDEFREEDISYNVNFYHPEDIFEGDIDFIELSNDNFSEREFNENVNLHLASKPLLERSVYYLYFIEGFDVEQIAWIKEITAEEVAKIIEETTGEIKAKLKQKIEKA